MKLDFEYLHKVSDNLHQLYHDAGGYNPDEHVFSVHFSPESNKTRCLISWSYFCNLIANEADAPCEMSRVGDALHLRARVHGIEVVCCVFKQEVVSMLEKLVAEHPCDDVKYSQDDDIESLFNLWRDLTGWNMEVNK